MFPELTFTVSDSKTGELIPLCPGGEDKLVSACVCACACTRVSVRVVVCVSLCEACVFVSSSVWSVSLLAWQGGFYWSDL